jgi:hypothetical protein
MFLVLLGGGIERANNPVVMAVMMPWDDHRCICSDERFLHSIHFD